jgi:hypothetical protein
MSKTIYLTIFFQYFSLWIAYQNNYYCKNENIMKQSEIHQ